MRMLSIGRRSLSALVASLLAFTGLVVLAPAANAEPAPLVPDKHTCGRLTCTAYWSVSRTRELHAEWKDTVTGLGTMGAAGAALAGAVPKHPVAAGVVAGIGFVVAARSVEFNHMINGAANDNRCLIYKYSRVPPEAMFAGWFGSVSPSNANCDD